MEVITRQERSSTATLLNCSTLISYLKTLSQETLAELYGHPATCLAVFRLVTNVVLYYMANLLPTTLHTYNSSQFNF